MNSFVCKRFSLLYIFVLACAALWAQSPADYYASAKGAKGKALKTSLSKIISSHTARSYNDLWQDFKKTDVRPDGKIWDMYSNATSYAPGGSSQGANYKGEGDSYNREHSFPKSWFNDAKPMYTDLFHLYPTDGYVNNRRSNYPYGETEGETYQSKGGFSKLGKCTIPGYNGVVFEPNDEYKGDLARTYFYMVTAYEDKVASWSSPMLNGTSYPAFSDWTLTMFLRWATEDPVSTKEVNRNDAVYAIQHNRNPYIDYPGLEQYVWGTMMAVAFNPYDYQSPSVDPNPNPNPNPDPNPDPNPNPNPNPDPDPNPGETTNLYVLATSASDIAAGKQVLIVCAGKGKALSASSGTYRAAADVTVTDERTISAETNAEGMPVSILLNEANGNYLLKDTQTNEYLSYSGSKNTLTSTADATNDDVQWTIDVSGEGNAVIRPRSGSGRSICYNATSPRFACYASSSKQQPVSLFVRQTASSVSTVVAQRNAFVDVYDLNGRCVRRHVAAESLRHLPSGIYVVNGRKVLVR